MSTNKTYKLPFAIVLMIGFFFLSFGTVLSSGYYLSDVNTEETLDLEEEISETNEFESELKVKLLGSTVEEFTLCIKELLTYVQEGTSCNTHGVYTNKTPLFILFHSLKIDC